MEGGVLEIVVVEGYEDGEGDEKESEEETEEAGTGVGEGGVAH